MKRILQYLKKEAHTTSQTYIFFGIIQFLIIVAYFFTPLLLDESMKQTAELLLIIFLFAFIIISSTAAYIKSDLADKRIIKDIKVFPGTSFSYFITKYYYHLAILAFQLIIITKIWKNGSSLIAFVILYTLMIIMPFAIIKKIYKHVSLWYKLNLLLVTSYSYICVSILASISLVYHLAYNDSYTMYNVTITYLCISTLFIFIWSKIFDKKFEI